MHTLRLPGRSSGNAFEADILLIFEVGNGLLVRLVGLGRVCIRGRHGRLALHWSALDEGPPSLVLW